MANVNIRVDDNVKQDIEQIFADIGLTLTTATNAFYKQVIRHQGMPFELKADPFYSEKNLERLKQSISQMEATGGTIHDIESIK